MKHTARRTLNQVSVYRQECSGAVQLGKMGKYLYERYYAPDWVCFVFGGVFMHHGMGTWLCPWCIHASWNGNLVVSLVVVLTLYKYKKNNTV